MTAVNDPATLAEVTAAFARYEQALVTNDGAVLDSAAFRRGAAAGLA